MNRNEENRGKVISLSLFGTNTKYTRGSLKFVESARKHLPDWKIVFFVGRSVSESQLQKLKLLGVNVIQIDEPEGLAASSWRFRIWLLGNPGWIIFRDADSVVSAREAKAVEQWVNSGHTAHIIRDHPFHSAPILAGLWGLRLSFSSADWFSEEVRKYSFTDTYGSDQDFLANIVYPKIVNSCLVHASFHTHEQEATLGSFQAGHSRLGSFCGESVTAGFLTRSYARLRRLIDPKGCTCKR
jgi:hypothetical protein